MSDPDDYHLWKNYWFATLYGASPERRMRAIDKLRRMNARARDRMRPAAAPVT